MRWQRGLRRRRWGWIAIGILGLPGIAFGLLTIVFGVFFALVFLVSIPLSKFAALDHVAASLTGSYIIIWVATASGWGWAGLALVASAYCTTVAIAKLGRIVGSRLFGHAPAPHAA